MPVTRERMALVLLMTALLVFSGTFAGYQVGFSKGNKEASETASMRARYLRDRTTCVYLALAMSQAQSDHPREAEQLRNLLLFSAALDIQMALDSGKSEQAGIDRTDAEGVLKDVSRIFWRDPASIDVLDGDPIRQRLKPKLQAVFDHHKPGI